MNIQQIVGNYNILGNNPDNEENTYKGILSLTLNTDNEIIAKWLINENQVQIGMGILSNHTLIVSFSYIDDVDVVCNGTAIYDCKIPNILEGYWYEENAEPGTFGVENAFKITDNLLN